MLEFKLQHFHENARNSLTPRLYERGVFNFCPVTKHLQTGMYERPIWVHEFSRKKKFLHGPIHP